jgi:hypothetical protein
MPREEKRENHKIIDYLARTSASLKGSERKKRKKEIERNRRIRRKTRILIF